MRRIDRIQATDAARFLSHYLDENVGAEFKMMRFHSRIALAENRNDRVKACVDFLAFNHSNHWLSLSAEVELIPSPANRLEGEDLDLVEEHRDQFI